MTLLGFVFDAMLALSLPLLAWRVIAARDLFKGVILFIAFGLLVALSWARLGAPDIALAEAAIGAGITAPSSSTPWAAWQEGARTAPRNPVRARAVLFGTLPALSGRAR